MEGEKAVAALEERLVVDEAAEAELEAVLEAPFEVLEAALEEEAMEEVEVAAADDEDREEVEEEPDEVDEAEPELLLPEAAALRHEVEEPERTTRGEA